MLQPQNYPRFIGKALLLEPDPFVEMVDDDNPGLRDSPVRLYRCPRRRRPAHRQPPPDRLAAAIDALLNTVLQTLRQGTAGGETLFEIERTLRNGWPLLLAYSGYDSVGFRLLTLATTLSPDRPLAPLGFVSHLLARAAGGQGTLAQTLGAVALSNASRLLYLFTVIPFVSVAAVLIHVWGILIAFRGLEVAHELPPRPAALVAVGTYLLLLLVSAAVAVAFAPCSSSPEASL